jgi:hypothetical protein
MREFYPLADGDEVTPEHLSRLRRRLGVPRPA